METLSKTQRTALIQREVKKAQHELDEFNQAKKVTPLDLMLDQGEIERYILADNLAPGERARVRKIWSHDMAKAIGLIAALPLIISAMVAWFTLVYLDKPASLGVVATMVAFGALALAIASPSRVVKLFQGRKLAKEASRILRENQEQSTRYRELVDNADKNIVKASERLESIASLYEKSNPNRRLTIAADNSCIVEVHSDAVIQQALGSATALEIAT